MIDRFKEIAFQKLDKNSTAFSKIKYKNIIQF